MFGGFGLAAYAVSISALSDRGLLQNGDPVWTVLDTVSISALSDRGLLRRKKSRKAKIRQSFNIRSFGSWIASEMAREGCCRITRFQYPLFRIVDCF